MKVALCVTTKFESIVQFEAAETPALFVFEMITEFKAPGVPVIVISPAPPKFIIPSLVKPELPNAIVLAVEGVKFKVPVLVTVPAFVNEP